MSTSSRVRLTAGRVEGFACPAGKSQAFLWDTEVPSLLLRATPTGRKTFAFEARVRGGVNVRVPIGAYPEWSIESARERAIEFKQLADKGQDPRDVLRQQQADRDAIKVAHQRQIEADKVAAVTVGEVWAIYLEDRKPFWGERHYADHIKMAKAGGEPVKAGVKLNADGSRPRTVPGPVHELLDLPLRELTPEALEAWAAKHAKARPTVARLCWRCLKVFLNWCAEHSQYSGLLATANPAKTKRTREVLGKAKAKDDALQREQLQAWFAAVQQIGNPTISAFLQVLLLVGCRPGHVLTLKWEGVDFQWNSLKIGDKVEEMRVIPLTPYVKRLLANLPRHNEWVFASTRALKMDAKNVSRRERDAEHDGRKVVLGDVKFVSATGHIAVPGEVHRQACKAAGVAGLGLNGLRRSFSSVTEWLEIPSGVVAQIQGHKPSATAEKHYKRRPLDLLRLHHERIEAWILEQAGIQFESKQPATKLKVVGS